MKLLVVGSGGREHAISKKLLASPLVSDVFCLPGNPGMTRDGITCVAGSLSDHLEIVNFAKEKEVAWTFIGPEEPLVNGLVDAFQEAGLQVFGPNKKAAQIEGSKEFAKKLMVNYGIPTAAYQSFTDYDSALAYVVIQGLPLVIKADGLAAGKGVVIPETLAEAKTALKEMLLDNCFADNEPKVVIEEFLVGEEFSLLSFVHQGQVYPLEIAQDHKRVFDGDEGPNTGGMGAYSPVPQISQRVISQSIQEVVFPTVAALAAEGCHFSGVLYAGLINTAQGPKVIEFNARMGDPETQVLLSQLASDLASDITQLLAGESPEFVWHNDQISLGVMVAANGYPGDYQRGLSLPDFTQVATDVEIFFSGVAENDGGQLVSDGGRVFILVSRGETVSVAQEKAYRALADLELRDFHYRKDIGFKAKLALID